MSHKENSQAEKQLRSVRSVSERELAITIVLELAQSSLMEFSLMGFYDDDHEFLMAVSKTLNVPHDSAFRNKMHRVVRRLVQYGVLYGQMRRTDKEYIDEPAKQMCYGFTNPGAARILSLGKTEHTGTPEWEAAFLLRRAYPEDE